MEGESSFLGLKPPGSMPLPFQGKDLPLDVYRVREIWMTELFFHVHHFALLIYKEDNYE